MISAIRAMKMPDYHKKAITAIIFLFLLLLLYY